MDSKPLRFLIVGLIVTTIDLATTWMAALLTGTRIIAVTMGFLCGLLASYLLHAKVTFSADLVPITQVPRFLMLVALNYILMISIVLLSTEILEFSTIIGKVLSLPIVAVSTYLISKHWIYCLSPTKGSARRTCSPNEQRYPKTRGGRSRKELAPFGQVELPRSFNIQPAFEQERKEATHTQHENQQ